MSFRLVTSEIIQVFLLVRCSFCVFKYLSINRSIHLSIFHLSLCIIYIIYIIVPSIYLSLYHMIAVLHLSYVLLCRKWFLSKLVLGPLDIGIVEKYLVSHEHRPPSPMFWGSFYMNRLLLGISSPIMFHFSLSLSLILSFSHSLILSFSHSLIFSFSHSLILSFSHSLILSFSHSLILSYSHSLILSFSHILILSFSHILILSFSHILILSFSHSLIFSLSLSLSLSLPLHRCQVHLYPFIFGLMRM